MIDEKTLEALRYDIRDMHTDYKAEAIVADLIKKGIHPDRIIVQPKSTSKRSYRKDVSDFHTETFDYDNKEYLFLHTHRDGLYDALPQNIFHQPTRGKTEKNKYEVIDEIKQHRIEEEEARRFFLPYEHEYNNIRTVLYTIEEEFEKHTQNSKVIEVFSKHWPILKKLDAYHAYIFLRIIPLIHTIRNDFELTSKSISLILGVPVEVSLFKTEVQGLQFRSFKLGEGMLGQDTVIGNNANDGEYDVKVKIGPLSPEEIEDFLYLGKHAEVINELLDFFLGANYYFYKEIIADQTNNDFVVREKGTSVLGVSSFL